MSNLFSRRWLAASGLALLATVAVCIVPQQWMRKDDPVPTATVSGLSMAPRFRCAHFELKCNRCSHRFFVAAERADGSPIERPPALARCPLCRESATLTLVASHPGDKIRISAAPSKLKRFDVVAFGSNPIRIKRVIGLPGERIRIEDGDVFINGQRFQKTLNQFFDTSVVVSRFGHRVIGSAFSRDENKIADWTFDKRVDDMVTFDPTTSRRLTPVGDAILSLEAHWDLPVEFEISVHDGWYRWHAVFRCKTKEDSSVQIHNSGGTNLQYNLELPKADSRIAVHFGSFDQQIVLNLSGHDIVSHTFRRPAKTRVVDSKPVSLRVNAGQLVQVSGTVWRDLYYLPNSINEPFTKNEWQIGEERVFVLGDYSSVSIDSRSGKIGMVPKREIHGIAVPLNAADSSNSGMQPIAKSRDSMK